MNVEFRPVRPWGSDQFLNAKFDPAAVVHSQKRREPLAEMGSSESTTGNKWEPSYEGQNPSGRDSYGNPTYEPQYVPQYQGQISYERDSYGSPIYD
jgi:hypothetical protein